MNRLLVLILFTTNTALAQQAVFIKPQAGLLWSFSSSMDRNESDKIVSSRRHQLGLETGFRFNNKLSVETGFSRQYLANSFHYYSATSLKPHQTEGPDIPFYVNKVPIRLGVHLPVGKKGEFTVKAGAAYLFGVMNDDNTDGTLVLHTSTVYSSLTRQEEPITYKNKVLYDQGVVIESGIGYSYKVFTNVAIGIEANYQSGLNPLIRSVLYYENLMPHNQEPHVISTNKGDAASVVLSLRYDLPIRRKADL